MIVSILMNWILNVLVGKIWFSPEVNWLFIVCRPFDRAHHTGKLLPKVSKYCHIKVIFFSISFCVQLCWNMCQNLLLLVLIIIILIMTFISSAALSEIRRAAGTCHSVLTKRCDFRRRAKVAVDSVGRRSSAAKLFQITGLETAKFLEPMAVTVHCMSCLPEAADCRCRRPWDEDICCYIGNHIICVTHIHVNI